jgi:hypothetical protein
MSFVMFTDLKTYCRNLRGVATRAQARICMGYADMEAAEDLVLIPDFTQLY